MGVEIDGGSCIAGPVYTDDLDLALSQRVPYRRFHCIQQ